MTKTDLMEYFLNNIADGKINPHRINLKVFPDWILNRLIFDENKEVTQDLMEVTTALYLAKRGQLTEVADVSVKELYDAALAFGKHCQGERLRRQGLLKDYSTNDPFSLNSLTKAEFPKEIIDEFKKNSGTTH